MAKCAPLGGTADAQSVQHTNLQKLCDSADKIFRGTVLDVSPTTVAAGGGILPAASYRIRVSESFKGSYTTKGDQQVAEITMVGMSARLVRPTPAPRCTLVLETVT